MDKYAVVAYMVAYDYELKDIKKILGDPSSTAAIGKYILELETAVTCARNRQSIEARTLELYNTIMRLRTLPIPEQLAKLKNKNWS